MLENIRELLEPISKFFYVITHPIIIFNWFVRISYWLAVWISLISLLFFISTKSKKSKQILQGTILAYVLIKAIESVVR